MKKQILILGVAAMLVAPAAFAQTKKPVCDEKNQNCKEKYQLDWAMFKEQCANPEGNKWGGPQVAPANIVVTCSESRTYWIPGEAGAVELPNVREIEAVVDSHKFQVGKEVHQIPAYQKPGVCQSYREIEETITIPQSVSCHDILDYNKYNKKDDKEVTLGDLCKHIIDKMKGGKQGEIVRQETGRGYDCAGAEQKGGKPGKVVRF